ncbi:MAG: hypothetical protein AB2651_22185, partial [Candidatus Thiodiazotropha sp.]
GRIIAQGPIGKSAIISIFPRMASDSVHYSHRLAADVSTLKENILLLVSVLTLCHNTEECLHAPALFIISGEYLLKKHELN